MVREAGTAPAVSAAQKQWITFFLHPDIWPTRKDLNLEPSDLESGALPIELREDGCSGLELNQLEKGYEPFIVPTFPAYLKWLR